MIINSALNAPASLNASRIATISVAVVPVSFNASTNVWSSIPGSKTKALAGCCSTSISVSWAVVAAVPATVAEVPTTVPVPSDNSLVSSWILTDKLPWATAAGEILTSPPITTVPVLELTTTLAFGLTGSKLIFSNKPINETFWDGFLGVCTLIDVESSGMATSGPKVSFIVSAILSAWEKSAWCKFRTILSFSRKVFSTSLSTVAPPGILPTVGVPWIVLEPSAPSIPRPPTTRLPWLFHILHHLHL